VINETGQGQDTKEETHMNWSGIDGGKESVN